MKTRVHHPDREKTVNLNTYVYYQRTHEMKLVFDVAYISVLLIFKN